MANLPPRKRLAGVRAPVLRVGRWMLDGLAVLSLLLCVATCVVWVRAWAANDTLELFTFYLSGEHMRVTVSPRSAGIDNQPQLDDYNQSAMAIGRELNALADQFAVTERSASKKYSPRLTVLTKQYQAAAGPHVKRAYSVQPRLVISLLATFPLACFAWARWGRRRRQLGGYCSSCQYDLTGNVSGVCPECGRKIAEAK